MARAQGDPADDGRLPGMDAEGNGTGHVVTVWSDYI